MGNDPYYDLSCKYHNRQFTVRKSFDGDVMILLCTQCTHDILLILATPDLEEKG